MLLGAVDMANSQTLYYIKAKGQPVEVLATFYDTKISKRVLDALEKCKQTKEAKFFIEENKPLSQMSEYHSQNYS